MVPRGILSSMLLASQRESNRINGLSWGHLSKVCILAGSWGLTRWYANQIQSLIETRTALEFEIQEARQTIERIEQTTWGVKLVEVNGGRFAILPESTPENPLGIMDGRPTVRLSSE